jgi:hypothetical protein
VARKSDETLRLAQERALASPEERFRAESVVDGRYRLQPADLPTPLVRAQVRAVTLQGMEAPALLLHLTGLPKPLVLDSPNRETLLTLTGTSIFESWVGRELELHVVGAPGAQRIVVTPPGAPPPRPPSSELRGRSSRSRLTTTLFVLLVLLLVLLAVYWIERGGTLP